MSKFSFLKRFVPLQPLQPLLLVDTPVEALFSQSRGTVEALLSSMVRRISLLKRAVFFITSRGCRGYFPNSSQEIELLRESVDFSPSDGDEWHSTGESYTRDEYDYSDFADWQEDMYNEVGWPDDDDLIPGIDDSWDFTGASAGMWNPEGHREWLDAHPSWEQQAVDEIIDAERPGEYPANLPDELGDIPF